MTDSPAWTAVNTSEKWALSSPIVRVRMAVSARSVILAYHDKLSSMRAGVPRSRLVATDRGLTTTRQLKSAPPHGNPRTQQRPAAGPANADARQRMAVGRGAAAAPVGVPLARRARARVPDGGQARQRQRAAGDEADRRRARPEARGGRGAGRVAGGLRDPALLDHAVRPAARRGVC